MKAERPALHCPHRHKAPSRNRAGRGGGRIVYKMRHATIDDDFDALPWQISQLDKPCAEVRYICQEFQLTPTEKLVYIVLRVFYKQKYGELRPDIMSIEYAADDIAASYGLRYYDAMRALRALIKKGIISNVFKKERVE